MTTKKTNIDFLYNAEKNKSKQKFVEERKKQWIQLIELKTKVEELNKLVSNFIGIYVADITKNKTGKENDNANNNKKII